MREYFTHALVKMHRRGLGKKATEDMLNNGILLHPQDVKICGCRRSRSKTGKLPSRIRGKLEYSHIIVSKDDKVITVGYRKTQHLNDKGKA